MVGFTDEEIVNAIFVVIRLLAKVIFSLCGAKNNFCKKPLL
jgi:hypothetical protein